ncbi:flagellar assembly protein FliH [Oceanisphaera sp. KMM 10153]|uniref:flagellar assembly protein FliH n=1 Tax=Oceanisphaera submarina TaxID=3390193 RepID=UPI0039751A75
MSRNAYSSGHGHPPRDENADAEHWSWPDMAQPRVASKERALNIKRRVEVATPEPVFEPDPEPLTAEALEAIRQAAYEEGFEQGKQEGQAAGQEEGRLTGLQQGHEAGLQQGLEQGLAEGQEQIEQLRRQWQQLLEGLQAPLAQIDRVVEQSLVTLAQELARNLLKTEVSTSPQLLLATVREALAALPGHEGGVTLFLHPDDLAIIEQHFDEKNRRQRGWELVSEPGQGRGDLRVKTALSELDVSLALRIDELMANFLKANWNRFHDSP